jgi:hypothetical protein
VAGNKSAALKIEAAAYVPDVTIDIAAIPGVTAPVCGVAPVTTITETTQYTGTVSWNLPVSETLFATSTSYTATITLTPKTGYTLTGVTADFFSVAGASSVSNGASSGVITVTFPASLTISGEGLPSVSAEISYTVTPTGLESPPSAPQLKARTQGTTLHVTGLTAGRPWSVYALTGALIHRSIPTGSEADLTLPARGIYIIQSGNKAIKVVY